MKKEILISVDIEADGPIPGEYSMTSLGACAAVIRSENGECENLDVDQDTFYVEFKPISEKWDPEALAIGGLPREHFEQKGTPPEKAIADFCHWVDDIGKKYGARPVFAAYPASFDWMFTYYYIMRFYGTSPFGFSGVLDMKSLISGKTGRTLSKSTKRNLPKHLFSKRKHTHNALDDALEQGIFLQNILAWKV